MADFEVRTDSLRHSADRFDRINREVREVSDAVRTVLNSTSRSITARMAYQLQRAVVCASINNCAADCKSLSCGLDNVARLYEQFEKKVQNAELFDNVFSFWNLISIFDWRKIPIIRPIFPKPIFPGFIDIIRPWGPFTPIPPRPWIPTPPPFKPGFWDIPWNRPTRPRPWIHVGPSGPGGRRPVIIKPYWNDGWWRPWRPVPPRPYIPIRPNYPVWIKTKPRYPYVIRPVGPGGQNPFNRITYGSLAVSPLIGVSFASVGAAVRLA